MSINIFWLRRGALEMLNEIDRLTEWCVDRMGHSPIEVLDVKFCQRCFTSLSDLQIVTPIMERTCQEQSICIFLGQRVIRALREHSEGTQGLRGQSESNQNIQIKVTPVRGRSLKYFVSLIKPPVRQLLRGL